MPEYKGTYRYPLRKLDTSDDYLQIDIIEYKPPGFGSAPGRQFALNSSDNVYESLLSGSGSIKDVLSSIILPIPEGITDNQTAQWGPDTRGPLDALAANLTSESAKKGLSGLKNNITGKVKSIIGNSSSQANLKSVFTSAAINALSGGSDISATLSRVGGVIFNPNVEMLFGGVNIRGPFVFNFNMSPRFQKESNEIRDIIRLFKSNMAPKRSSGLKESTGLFVKSPNVFRLRYMSGGKPHPYLNRFKICALQGLAVNYTESGTYATYSDSAPVNLSLQLQFQELSPIFSEDYNNGQGKGGTGY